MVRRALGSAGTWQCALLAGLVSTPLTAALHWQSGVASLPSLGVAFVAGVLAGYLAGSSERDIAGASAGLRAGVLGALPGLWFVVEMLRSVGTAADLAWFHVVGAGAVVLLFTTALLVLTAFAGFVGATAGMWLSGRSRARSRPRAAR